MNKITRDTLKRGGTGRGVTLEDIKTYQKASIIKTGWDQEYIDKDTARKVQVDSNTTRKEKASRSTGGGSQQVVGQAGSCWGAGGQAGSWWGGGGKRAAGGECQDELSTGSKSQRRKESRGAMKVLGEHREGFFHSPQ